MPAVCVGSVVVCHGAALCGQLGVAPDAPPPAVVGLDADPLTAVLCVPGVGLLGRAHRSVFNSPVSTSYPPESRMLPSLASVPPPLGYDGAVLSRTSGASAARSVIAMSG